MTKKEMEEIKNEILEETKFEECTLDYLKTTIKLCNYCLKKRKKDLKTTKQSICYFETLKNLSEEEINKRK